MCESLTELCINYKTCVSELCINYKTCVSAGISNHEEYSLVREMTDDEKEKTLTLRRDKSIAKDQKKLEEMRKKLHTDDERTSVSGAGEK